MNRNEQVMSESPVLKFRSACDMFYKRQSDQETVDQYANKLRNSAKRADMSKSTLLFAFVSGLKGKLARFVLGKTPLFLKRRLMRPDWQKCRWETRTRKMVNFYRTKSSKCVKIYKS